MYETYPKSGGGNPGDNQPAMQEDVRPNPYTQRAEMGDPPDEQYERQINVYGKGTGVEPKGGEYGKKVPERSGFPVNPARTMRSPL